MEEALIQYISLLLIVAIFHSSPPSFQTAGIVTQLQQLTCSEERGVTLLGMTSLSLHKLCSSALCPSHRSFCRTRLPHLLDPCLVPGSHPRWTRTRDKGQQNNPAIRIAAGRNSGFAHLGHPSIVLSSSDKCKTANWA